MAKQNLISEAIISYHLSREQDQKDDGTVMLGGLDQSKFEAATLTTIDNTNDDGFWGGAIESATVDGQELGFTGHKAILDTGTTLMLLPQAVVQKIHDDIPGAQGPDDAGEFLVPCDTTAVVSITFGGRAFDIDPRDLAFNRRGAGMCTSGIVPGGLGDDTTWLLG